jgi:hypothetical protein
MNELVCDVVTNLSKACASKKQKNVNDVMRRITFKGGRWLVQAILSDFMESEHAEWVIRYWRFLVYAVLVGSWQL